MLSFELKKKRVGDLPTLHQLAFVAACLERALRAILLREVDYQYASLFRSALDFGWQLLADRKLIYNEEAVRIHVGLTDIAMTTRGHADGLHSPDPLTNNCASALTLFFGTLRDPSRGPVNCLSASYIAIDIIGLIFQEGEEDVGEENWQEAALDLLEEWGDRPLSQEIFAGLPEYERGPIYLGNLTE